MRKLAMLIAALLLSAALPGGSMQPRAAEAGAAAESLPNFTLTTPPKPVPPAKFNDAAGKSIDLSAFRGRVVLVNLWATWCPPCRAEMPALDRLQAALGSPDFQVVAVSQDIDKAKAQAFLQHVGATHLGFYIDESMLSGRTWGGIGLPTTLLVDRDGSEVGRIIGPAEWDSPEAKALIEHFLQKPAAEKQLRTEAVPGK